MFTQASASLLAVLGLLYVPALLTNFILRSAFRRANAFDARAQRALGWLTAAYPLVTVTLCLIFAAPPNQSSLGLTLAIAPMSLIAAIVLYALSKSVLLALAPVVAAAPCIILDQIWGANPSGPHPAGPSSLPIWLGTVFVISWIWSVEARRRGRYAHITQLPRKPRRARRPKPARQREARRMPPEAPLDRPYQSGPFDFR